ncbi:MAG TPA: RNA polymerase sigma factor [Sphingobacteriaceae bacterium]|nr:RNA polymerase sigma factor [Sphingobacteriaceae bacterium]
MTSEYYLKNDSSKLGMEDAEILEKFANKRTREEAFTMLLNKYQERIYWHVRRYVLNHDDADDLVQDIFVKIWNNLDKFRADAKLYTWIYRIATNESITFLNKKKQMLNVSLNEESSSYLLDTLTQTSYFDASKAELKLQEALLILPDKQRLVFNMKYFEDLKYDEISEILGTSVGALKTSYHFAVKKIEKYFSETD